MFRYIKSVLTIHPELSHCCYIYQNMSTKQYVISNIHPNSDNITKKSEYLSNVGKTTIISMNDIINKRVIHNNITYLLE